MIFGAGAPRLGNTSNVALPGLAAENSVIALDLDGVMVSSGSSCSSGKVAPSHVLAAMGVADELAARAMRVSFGWNSTDATMPMPCVASLVKLAARVRAAEGCLMSSAAPETKEQVAELGEKYKYGFVTDIEMERAPKGLTEDTVRYHLGQEGRAGLDAGMAAGRLPPLADDERAEMGAGALSARSIIRTPIITPRPRTRP